MWELQGCVAVVTGAGMGMGRQLAVRLYSEGCSLALCDVDMIALEQTQQICAQQTQEGRLITIHKVDVSDRHRVKAFAAEVAEAHGGILNLLFNNAGICRASAFDRMSAAEFDKVMGVNFDGVVSCTREFWPQLLKATKAAIVNTSSVAGFMPPAANTSTPYAASKYAVRGFSEHLAWQCNTIAPHITVSAVHPG